ncbi:reverse transcriptase domain-containing protein [Tanacetum coccineum]
MIKADWSLPFEIMCDASDYVVGAVLGQRMDKHFKPIHYASKTMNEAQENYTTTKNELLVVVFAFNKFCQYLVLSKTIIRDKKGAENIVADHLSRLENPDLGMLTRAEIRDLFPEERLMAIFDKNNKPCVLIESYKGAWPEMRQYKFFDNVTADHPEDIMASPPPQERSLRPGFTGHISFAMRVS